MHKRSQLIGWERHTRDEDKSLGVRKAGTEHMEGSSFADLFKSGRYDQDKMVRSFARLGAIESDAVGREEDTEVNAVEKFMVLLKNSHLNVSVAKQSFIALHHFPIPNGASSEKRWKVTERTLQATTRSNLKQRPSTTIPNLLGKKGS